jgi:hypothetical protein
VEGKQAEREEVKSVGEVASLQCMSEENRIWEQ